MRRTFDEFKDDMYESYLRHINKFGSRNTSIERINNNGNYYKENCKWATWKEQARNRYKNNIITYCELFMRLRAPARISFIYI